MLSSYFSIVSLTTLVKSQETTTKIQQEQQHEASSSLGQIKFPGLAFISRSLRVAKINYRELAGETTIKVQFAADGHNARGGGRGGNAGHDVGRGEGMGRRIRKRDGERGV